MSERSNVMERIAMTDCTRNVALLKIGALCPWSFLATRRDHEYGTAMSESRYDNSKRYLVERYEYRFRLDCRRQTPTTTTKWRDLIACVWRTSSNNTHQWFNHQFQLLITSNRARLHCTTFASTQHRAIIKNHVTRNKQKQRQ